MGDVGYTVGAARVDVTPGPGLPMVGFVRQWQVSQGTGRYPLEVTALAIEAGGTLAILCGADTAGIQAPAIDRIRDRIAAATGAVRAGIVISFNHTHLAPANGAAPHWLSWTPEPVADGAIEAYGARLADAIVEACAQAAARRVPARVRWAVGTSDVAVNRRERADEGRTILGWNPALPVDTSVTALTAEAADGATVGTAVVYGCHPVTAGWDVVRYSADFPGPLRETVERHTGAPCAYLQGAAGNVLPRVAFTADEAAAERMGRAIGLAALDALARSADGPVCRPSRAQTGSMSPIALYRVEADDPPAVVAAAEVEARFPLQPLPTAAELERIIADGAARLREAEARAAPPAELATLRYDAAWAAAAAAELATGAPRTEATGSIVALRIGDGALATGPGEIFTEIGLAVKERSPAATTAYGAYANGLVTYFATAAEYPHGGYEPGFGNRSFGLPAQVTAASERILVETAVRLLERLWPDAEPWPAERGFAHLGGEPAPTATRYVHPAAPVSGP